MMFRFTRSILLVSAALSSAALAGSRGEEPSLATLRLSTEKDASLIRESYCCGFVADQNFGSAATVDAGQYHHRSEALIGFSRAEIPASAPLRRATLEVEARLVGSAPAAADIAFSSEAWDEATVTFNEHPETQGALRHDFLPGLNAIEVTELVREALAEDGDAISFHIRVPAGGQANIFLTSKEASTERAATLVLEFETTSVR